MEEPKSNLKYKRSNSERLKKKKLLSIKRMQKEWEWGTNKYICPNSVTIFQCHSQKKPNTEVNESHILAPKELSKLLNIGYHTPQDYNQWDVLNLAFLEKSGFLNNFEKDWDKLV